MRASTGKYGKNTNCPSDPERGRCSAKNYIKDRKIGLRFSAKLSAPNRSLIGCQWNVGRKMEGLCRHEPRVHLDEEVLKR